MSYVYEIKISITPGSIPSRFINLSTPDVSKLESSTQNTIRRQRGHYDGIFVLLNVIRTLFGNKSVSGRSSTGHKSTRYVLSQKDV